VIAFPDGLPNALCDVNRTSGGAPDRDCAASTAEQGSPTVTRSSGMLDHPTGILSIPDGLANVLIWMAIATRHKPSRVLEVVNALVIAGGEGMRQSYVRLGMERAIEAAGGDHHVDTARRGPLTTPDGYSYSGW
jgi:hypothetical protein